MKSTITRFASEFEKAELGHARRQILFPPLIPQFLRHLHSSAHSQSDGAIGNSTPIAPSWKRVMKESASSADLPAITPQEWPSFTAGSLKEIATFLKTAWALDNLALYLRLGFTTGCLRVAQLVGFAVATP